MQRKVRSPLIIFQIYLLFVGFFFFYRLVLLSFHLDDVKENGMISFSNILSSLWMGLRFDLLTAGFILLVPYILFTLYDYINKKAIYKISIGWVYFFSFIILLVGISNIEYFNNFYKHLDSQALSWLDQPFTVIEMLFQEKSYWYVLPLLFTVFYIFYKLLNKIFKNSKGIKLSKKKAYLFHFISFAFIFITIRGNISGAPLKKEDSTVSDIVFLNELALNPIFVFEKSLEQNYKDKRYAIRFMDTQKALKQLKKYMGINQQKFKNPVAREVENHSEGDTVKKKNVVLVFMESMGTWKMKRYGDKKNMSPFIDSLFENSIAYTDMHSGGTHTYSGIYATNFSYPVTFNTHPLKGVEEKKYYGIPQILKEKGYQTSFFIPHGPEFDNLWSFLNENDYDHIYYNKDYPQDSIRTAWGVDDRFLFHFALNKIDLLHRQKKPFLATILTISDHPPYYIPDFIKGEDEIERAARFADWARKDFMKKAKAKPWYKNTLFIFVGDHGKTHKMIYPTPLSYSSIPLILYYDGVKPEKRTEMTMQMDILPILMKELKLNYVNNGMGQDVSKKKHKYVFIDYDNKYAVLSDSLLLVIDREKNIGLFKYKKKDKKNYLKKYPQEADSMALFLKSYLQGKQYILDHDLQSKKGIQALSGKNENL